MALIQMLDSGKIMGDPSSQVFGEDKTARVSHVASCSRAEESVFCWCSNIRDTPCCVQDSECFLLRNHVH